MARRIWKWSKLTVKKEKGAVRSGLALVRGVHVLPTCSAGFCPLALFISYQHLVTEALPNEGHPIFSQIQLKSLHGCTGGDIW